MTRRIEHHSMSRWPAARIHAALIDAECLRERLDELGGPAAELISHTVTEQEARFQLRQQLPEHELPTVIRNLFGGNLILDRSETWREQEADRFVGEVAATLQRVPSTITGSLWLHDLPGQELAEHTAPGSAQRVSEFQFRGEVGVHLPLLTDRAEELLARQVRSVIERERVFIADWLRRRS